MTLDMRGVRSGYGRLEILQGVSVHVGPGEIIGIIGPNGAGKSTLLKTAFGYLPPFSGSIDFEGNSLLGLQPDQVIRRGIGFVAQAGGLFAEMTVRDNLKLGSYVISGAREASRAVENVLARFPFFATRHRQIAGSLSGGEQRMLAIARALVVQPRLLLLDEPSAALAPRFIETVYETLRDLNRDGLSMLVVEQNVEAILKLAHRVYVLDIGRNAFEGTGAELRGSERVRQLYLGEEAVP